MPTTLDSYKLVTAAELKDAIGATVADGRMLQAIDFAAQKSIDLLGLFIQDDTSSLGVYTVETTPDDSIYDGHGSLSIFLRHLPVVSVTQVRTRPHPSNAWDVVDTAAYVVYLNRGEVRRVAFGNNLAFGAGFEFAPVAGWPEGPQLIGIDYKAGYATNASELSVIRQFQERLAAWDYLGRGRDTGLKSESANGVYSYTLQDATISARYGIPQPLVDIVRPYMMEHL